MSTEKSPQQPDRSEVLIRDEGGVRRIALHRPESRNGLTIQVNEALIVEFYSR